MRDIPVGNGSLLVNFDDKYQIRDVYFPHVGQENHTQGYPSRFGIWADGKFSWAADDGWSRTIAYLPGTLVTDVRLANKSLGIEIQCRDMVASHDNVYLRRVIVTDTSGRERHIRTFFHQDFRLYENKFGDTAYYDPETLSLIHFKKHRYFLINTAPHFDSFATGRKAFQDREGTWRDAEDGILSGGVTTEGSVDSTICIDFSLDAGGEFEFFYWIAAGRSHHEVKRLNEHVLEVGPERYLEHTSNYWNAWVNKNSADFHDLPDEIVEFYQRSLLILNSQIDDHGAILAANDSDVTVRATDHYSYLWTRDGAFIANALDRAGYSEITRSFYEMCRRIMHPDGYFLQKYNPDGSVASTWHPSWDANGKTRMAPIQEDETALVLWALWQHYDRFRDIDFAHRMYRDMIVPCADFMAGFRDDETGLPLPSWNLWEDRRGVHTFTCATVVAGLRAAACFARHFVEIPRADRYDRIAGEIVEAMTRHLYSKQHGRFLRSLQSNGDGILSPDATVDASLFGLFYFGCYPPDDEMVMATMAAVEDTLTNATPEGGIARFENDGYMRERDNIIGNSWFICTLWAAEYHIAAARSLSDLEKPMEMLRWVVDSAMLSGVLAEQIDPVTGRHLSVSPLTWSHSTFVGTVLSYQQKMRALSGTAKTATYEKS